MWGLVKVYEPRKDVALLEDALKELYLLRQAIDHQGGTVDSRLKTADQLRNKIQAALRLMEEEK